LPLGKQAFERRNEVTIAFGAAVHWALETLEKIQNFSRFIRFKNVTTFDTEAFLNPLRKRKR
jgi:2-oxoisovalerate dehydrogenase E1 component